MVWTAFITNVLMFSMTAGDDSEGKDFSSESNSFLLFLDYSPLVILEQPEISTKSEDGITHPLTEISAKVTNNISSNPHSTFSPYSRTIASFHSILSTNQYQIGNEVLTLLCYIMLAIAVPLNALNTVIFLQPGMWSSTHIYVLGMSVAQMVYLVTDLGWELVESFIVDRLHSFSYQVYTYYGMNIILPILQRGTYLVSCLRSAERLYAIVRPLHVKTSLLSGYPAHFLCAAYSLTFVYHVFKFFKIQIVEISDTSDNNGSMFLLQRTALFYSKEAVFVGLEYGSKIVFCYFPLILLIVLNALTMVELRRYSFQRRALGKMLSGLGDNRSRKERQTTVIIMTAAVSFVILSLPMAFQSLLSTTDNSFFGPWAGDTFLFVLITRGTHVCSLMTSVTDFLSFVTLCVTYRMTLCRLLRLRWLTEKAVYTNNDNSALT